MVLALSTTFISSTIYASSSERLFAMEDDRPATKRVAITLGDPKNPNIEFDVNYNQKYGMSALERIYLNGIGELNKDTPEIEDPYSFLLKILSDEKHAFRGLYDSRGPRGYEINGKYYPSIFAVLKDIQVSGHPNSAKINMILQALGKQIPDDQRYLVEQQLQQETLKQLIVDAEKNDEAALEALQTQITSLSSNVNTQSSFKDIPSVQAPDTLTTDTILYSASDTVTDLLEARMDTFDNTPGVIGVSSGDFMQSAGVWVKGTMSTAKQKEIKLMPEYKVNQQGITIGADVGEDNLVGVAYSMIRSKVKHTNMTEKATNHIGAIYGLYNFSDTIFLNGQLKYGRANIKKQRNTRDFNNYIAYGKTKAELIGGRVELGYYYNFLDRSQLIPSIGLSYDTVKIKKYKETGDGLNRTVGKRNGDKAAVTGGLMVNHAIDLKTFVLIPEVHTNVTYTLKRKNDKTAITLFEGLSPIYVPSGKPPKTSYKIGGSLKAAKSQNLELSLGYDLGLSKKFHSHSGYIQARVDF